MSTFNEKTGELELTTEEKESLNNPLPKNWAQKIMNWIIWGENKEFYDGENKRQD